MAFGVVYLQGTRKVALLRFLPVFSTPGPARAWPLHRVVPGTDRPSVRHRVARARPSSARQRRRRSSISMASALASAAAMPVRSCGSTSNAPTPSSAAAPASRDKRARLASLRVLCCHVFLGDEVHAVTQRRDHAPTSQGSWARKRRGRGCPRGVDRGPGLALAQHDQRFSSVGVSPGDGPSCGVGASAPVSHASQVRYLYGPWG